MPCISWLIISIMTTTTSFAPVNFAGVLPDLAARLGDKAAVLFPAGRDDEGQVGYTRLTFRQFQQETDRFAAGFQQIGVTRGMRVVLMVRPSLQFLPLTFALFKIGAVSVLIDPGMGRRNLLRCVAQSRPEGFVGVPLAHVARVLFPRYFRNVRINVTIGRRLFWGGYDLMDLRSAQSGQGAMADTGGDDMAAIIFTTGSTGPPKGVVYTHGMFDAQRRILRDAFDISEDDIDMPTFTLFAIFSVSLGATVVIPEMDPTRPALVDPQRIVEAVNTNGVTFSFGSPALWNRVSLDCVAKNTALPSLRRVIMAGAPVPTYLHLRLLDGILPKGADTYTPYGATEAMPITSFAGSGVLKETATLTQKGRGVCVGRPLPGVYMRVIRIRDDAVTRLSETEDLPADEVGEIIVRADVVSPSYFELPQATRLHKIYESEEDFHGPFWHRMGDVGYLDKQGRLWFCGRKNHRVETGEKTMFTVCCEAIFNEHTQIFRSALVGIGEDRYRQTPVMVIEPEKGAFPADGTTDDEFVRELKGLGANSPLTASIEHFLFHRRFPVDIRHNAKIFREQLAAWAAKKVGRQRRTVRRCRPM